MAEDLIDKNKREIVEEKLSRLKSGAPAVANLINGRYDPLIMVKCVEDLEESAKNISTALHRSADKMGNILDANTNKIEKSVNDFKDSIKEIGEKSDKLSSKLLWLNIVLTAATVIGAIATAILAFSD